jgi:hypothetical protein
VIAAEPGSKIVVVALGGSPVALHEQLGRWLVLRTGSDATGTAPGQPWVAVMGPLEVTEGLVPGVALAEGSVLGQTLEGGLGLSVRQLRPGSTASGDAKALLDEAHSVAVDPRNVLPLLEPTPAPTATAP